MLTAQPASARTRRGGSERQIAQRLALSPRTVDRHLENILGTLGCPSRAQVAAQAAHTRPGQTKGPRAEIGISQVVLPSRSDEPA
ncbi:LuxR C-terminal-related transcriptional regulator [Nocardia sp. R16R-3T]